MLSVAWIRRSSALCFVAILALGVTADPAQGVQPLNGPGSAGPPNQWIPIGPEGGTVTALAEDPTAANGVWAGTAEGGVFYSADGGATWTLRGLAPIGRIRSLAPDSADPDLLVAAGSVIAVSRDGGRTWEELGSAGAVGEPLAVGSPPVLFRRLDADPVECSEDLGTTWQPVAGLPADLHIERLAQAKSDLGRLWAVLASESDDTSRIFRSTDGGATWQAAEGNLPSDAVWVDIAVGGTGDATLRVIAADARLFASQDGGDQWQPAGTVEGEAIGFREILALELDRQDASQIYLLSGSEGAGGRVAVSSDGGASFELAEGVDGKTIQTTLPLSGPGRRALFGMATEGVWSGADGAATAQPSAGGLDATLVFSLAVLPGPPSRLFSVVPFFGLLERIGSLWQPSPVPASSPVIAVAEVQPDVLYATDANFFFLRSADSGSTWDVTSVDIEICLIPDLLAGTPAAPERLWVSGERIDLPACEALNLCGLFRSLDGGESFACIRGEVGGSADADGAGAPNYVDGLVIDPGDADRVFAASRSIPPVGVFRSLDGGSSWEHVLPDIPVDHLLILPLNPQVVFAVGDDVQRSLDGGTTWDPFEIDLPGGGVVSRLFAHPAQADTLLAGGAEGGVFVSDDAGASWQALGTGLPPGLGVDDLRVDPNDPRGFYVATEGLGVFGLTRTDTAPCVPSDTTMCLNDGRFEVTVAWEDFEGGRGSGHAMPQTTDSGWFWFFDPANVELLVKVIDGRVINGSFWFFYGSLSNVEYTLTVRDTATGAIRTYPNPAGRFASVGDTEAFPGTGSADTGSAVSPGARQPGGQPAPARPIVGTSSTLGTCQPDATTLCLQDGRFRVRVEWTDFQGGQGEGQAVPLVGSAADDSGFFWFFDPDNLELVVKVIDGRVVNGNFWFFYGALSNVGYTIEVTDVESGRRAVYSNPSGRFASVGDTETFAGPSFCGGLAGFPCGPGQTCDQEPGTCQVADAGGTCKVVPEVCPEVFQPVCGCDAITYGNDCERLRAGVAKDHEGSCSMLGSAE